MVSNRARRRALGIVQVPTIHLQARGLGEARFPAARFELARDSNWGQNLPELGCDGPRRRSRSRIAGAQPGRERECSLSALISNCSGRSVFRMPRLAGRTANAGLDPALADRLARDIERAGIGFDCDCASASRRHCKSSQSSRSSDRLGLERHARSFDAIPPIAGRMVRSVAL